MPDSSSNGPGDKKELSVETRLLIAFILMAAVLFTTPYFFKAPPGPTPDKKTEKVAAGKVTPPPPPPAVAAAATAPGQIAAGDEETITLDTDLYHIILSNRGAVARSWVLKKFKDSHQKQLELVNTAAAAVTGYPFSLTFKAQKPNVDLNNALYAVKRSADGLE